MTTKTFPKSVLRSVLDALEGSPTMAGAPMRQGQFSAPITYGLAPYARGVLSWTPHPDVPRKTMLSLRRKLRSADERLADYETWLSENVRPREPEWVAEKRRHALDVTAELRKIIAEALDLLV